MRCLRRLWLRLWLKFKYRYLLRFLRDRDMERRCIEAYERGDSKPLSQVIDELRAKIAEVSRG